MVVYGIQLGLGKHVWQVAPFNAIIQQMKLLIGIFFAIQAFYATSIALAKLSIVALYLRVFPHQLLHKISFTTSGLIVIMWISSIIAIIIEAIQTKGGNAIEFNEGEWATYVDYQLAASIINAVTDVILCVSPLPIVIKLQMSKRDKIIVSGLFGLGFLYVLSLCAFPFFAHLNVVPALLL
jgi:hypothetical protein